MATKTQVVDDLDGSPADEIVEFSLDGKRYEIDLSKANAAKLRETLQPFVTAGRPAGKGHKPENPQRRRHPDESRAIREWVRQHDPSISEFGRISSKYLEAWDRDRDESVFDE